MRALSLIFFALLFANMTCEDIDIDAPACVKKLIKDDPQPVEVWRYQFEDQTVYLVVGDCCDQYNSVYDSNCNLICHASGGITGNGDGRCPEFFDTATDGLMIWKKK
ncbi:MAG TPA: hypothetical protein PLJ08_00960 [Cyclobacteriaceae bacterium]|nr:hypothetical protein [Cyclobacteriaceae bacterium]